MDKQVAELIKTLNGGLQHLPDLAKEMIHQYVIGHAFLGIVFFSDGNCVACRLFPCTKNEQRLAERFIW
jgi:hypothetical protein